MRQHLSFIDTGTYTRRTRVLVVDDDPGVLSFLSFSLKSEGFRVSTATGAQEALDALSGRSPDLIILDIQLPYMDGYTLCQRLRALPQTRRTPVLFITGYADHTSLNMTHKVGAQGLIEKPIMFDELRGQIFDALRGRFTVPMRLKYAS